MKNRRLLNIEVLEIRRLLAAISMTNQEQMLLELVNRARLDPSAEAARYSIGLNDGLPTGTLNGDPKQPLAPNQLLVNAARLHSQDMLDADYFAHTNLQGKDPGDRIADAGYDAVLWAENISWGGSTGAIDQDAHVFERHEGLFKSPGHRQNILNDLLVEGGMGVRYGVFTTNGKDFNASMATENFGTRANKIFLTGVAYSDQLDSNSFYSIGEGMNGITVVAVNNSGERFQTETGTSGGYAIELSAGNYSVKFSGGALTSPVTFDNIVINNKNVKVDLNTAQLIRLTLSFDKSSINESSGSITATVSRSGATTSALQIDITSSGRSEATFPTSVEIPVGSSSATFSIIAIDDNLTDGDKDIAVEVSAAGHLADTATFKVVDNDLLVARPDEQLTLANQAVDVAVISNDLYPQSQLANLIVEIVTAPNPAKGSARVLNSQQISVSPAADYVGVISLTYRIRDPRIGVSESAELRVGVAASKKQNGLSPLDVDANGRIVPSDAMLVINLLNDPNASRLVEEMPSPLVKPFVDVNGSGQITPADALLIINELNSRSSGEGEALTNLPTSMVDYVDLEAATIWETSPLRRRRSSVTR